MVTAAFTPPVPLCAPAAAEFVGCPVRGSQRAPRSLFSVNRPLRSAANADRPGVRRNVGIRMDADLYSLLGVSRGASDADIKAGFRNKARKLHPDVNKAEDAKERFQEVNRAYEVLSDSTMRQRYDQFGEAGIKSGAGGGGAGVDFSGQDFGSFSDIFETFFGGAAQGGTASATQGRAGARRRSGPQPGDDLRLDVDVPFEKAVFGTEQKIRFSHLESCTTCDGSGVKPGSKPRSCTSCQGQGTVMQVVRTPLGMFQQTSTCSTCRGTGEVVDEYCGSCGGRGRSQVTKQLMITVPAGVDTGSRLRVRNEGDAGPRGGPPGDLYVMLRVTSSPNFRREGTNIYSTVDISYLDAILGRSIPVLTVDGPVDFQISPGTQPGAVLKIDGKGIPKLGNTKVRGAHFVTVNVKIPSRVSAEERKLVQELDELSGGGSSSNSSSTVSSASESSASKSAKSKGKGKGEGFFNFGGKKK